MVADVISALDDRVAPVALHVDRPFRSHGIDAYWTSTSQQGIGNHMESAGRALSGDDRSVPGLRNEATAGRKRIASTFEQGYELAAPVRNS